MRMQFNSMYLKLILTLQARTYDESAVAPSAPVATPVRSDAPAPAPSLGSPAMLAAKVEPPSDDKAFFGEKTTYPIATISL